MAKPITLSHQVRSGGWESMISANGGLPAHRYTPQVTQRWPRGSEPASPPFSQRCIRLEVIEERTGREGHGGRNRLQRSTRCSVSLKSSPGRPGPWRSAGTGVASPSSTSTNHRQAAPHGRGGRPSGQTYKCMPRHAASVGDTQWSSPATPTSTWMPPPTRPRSTSERAGRPPASEGPQQAAWRT